LNWNGRAGAYLEVLHLDEDDSDSISSDGQEITSDGSKTVYPIELGDVSLQRSDVLALQENAWTPQLIVDFYMEHLQHYLSTNGIFNTTILNSCWLTKFTQRFQALDMESPYELDCTRIKNDNVRGWGHGRGLFTKAFIMVPVIYNHHWSLLVVIHPGSVMNDDTTSDRMRTCIVHLDSMRGQHANVDKFVRLYLFEEYISLHCTDGSREEGVDERLVNVAWERFVHGEKFATDEPDVPQQANTDDCGMFVCHYAQLICERLVQNWKNEEVTPHMSTWFTESWFSPKDVMGKRMTIMDLIVEVASSKHPSYTLDEMKSFIVGDKQ
jgi:sentrin-specific protease 7